MMKQLARRVALPYVPPCLPPAACLLRAHVEVRRLVPMQAAAPVEGVEYPLALGGSFDQEGGACASYTLLRYDFKPASVEQAQAGSLELGGGSRAVARFSGGGEERVFEGHYEPSRDACDAVLLFRDGQLRLELLAGTCRSLRLVGTGRVSKGRSGGARPAAKKPRAHKAKPAAAAPPPAAVPQLAPVQAAAGGRVSESDSGIGSEPLRTE